MQRVQVALHHLPQRHALGMGETRGQLQAQSGAAHGMQGGHGTG